MREYKIVPGGRRWHGDELVGLQEETLKILQSFFKQAGACVIDGCEVTISIGSFPVSFNIAPGLVGINHSDGYKVARFAGINNVSIPGWLYIEKTIQNKLYDDANNKVAYYEYKATYSPTQPAGTDWIKLEMNGGKSWINGFKTDFTTEIIGSPSPLTPGNVTGQIMWRKNRLTNTLHLRGTVTTSAAQQLSAPPYGTVLFQLPSGVAPAIQCWFNAFLLGGGASWFKDSYGLQYLTEVSVLVSSLGTVSINMRKPEAGVNGYTVFINHIISLD